MPRKIEKNAKSKEEALRLAAEEFGVSIEELSYTVEREIGKGISWTAAWQRGYYFGLDNEGSAGGRTAPQRERAAKTGS